MKIFTLLSFLVITAIQSFAQQNSEKLFYVTKSEKYRKMKNTGTVLTIAGSLLTVVGIVTLANSTVTTTYYGGGPTQTTTTGNPGGGAIAFLLGAASLGAGIPLWIVGAHSERKYDLKLESISLGLNLNPQRTGLTLTGRF